MAALSDAATYGDLFDDAFGTPDINAARIAMAIATYERTVVPDQTPWDLHTLTSRQSAGLLTFLGTSCTTCHSPPQFTSNTFRNIGLRDPDDDPGRFEVTHNADDRGRFKVPSLRNVGLRDRLMHTGHITGVADAIQFYRGIEHTHFPDNQDPLVQGGIVISESAVADMIDFLENGLTDPRAAAGEFPVDRPKLFSEVTASVAAVPPALLGLASAPNPFRSHTVIRYTTTPGPVELAVVKSPIVGTFYRSPEPGAPSFVEIGERVRKDQVLCIIEAMKLMNEIEAEMSGTVVEVYAQNGKAVEFGQKLFRIKKA